MTGIQKRVLIAGVAFTAAVAALVYFSGGLATGQTDQPKEPSYVYSVEGKQVTARDLKGEVVWQASIRENVDSIQLLGDYVFAKSANLLTCLTKDRGVQKWILPIGGEKKLNIVGGALFVQAPALLVRVDIDKGAEKWRFSANGDKMQSYDVLGERAVVVLTDRRMTALSYSDGRSLVVQALERRKYVGTRLVGSVLLVELEDEIGLYDADRGTKIAVKTPRDFEKWAAMEPSQALDEIRKLLRATSQNGRLEALATLQFMKAKSGKPWLAELVGSQDKNIAAQIPDVMSLLAGFVKSSTKAVSSTATAAVGGLDAAEGSGKIEQALNTAILTAYPEELPNAQNLLSINIKLLQFGTKEMRADAINLLKGLTGEDFGFKADGKMTERLEAVAKWNDWFQKYLGSFEWDVANRKIKVS